MRKFLTLTAILEGLTGISLIAIPNIVVLFLLGTPVTDTGWTITAMLAGAAILSLAVICWLLRKAAGSQNLVIGMLVYNGLVIAISLLGVFSYHLTGFGLWLVIGSHSVLVIYGAVILLRR